MQDKKTVLVALGGVDRAAKQVCGWTLGDRGAETARRLAAQLPQAAYITLGPGFWHPHGLIFVQQRRPQGKANTFAIASHHNRLRVYPARLRRKTHCYTKKLGNLAASILFYLLRKT